MERISEKTRKRDNPAKSHDFVTDRIIIIVVENRRMARRKKDIQKDGSIPSKPQKVVPIGFETEIEWVLVLRVVLSHVRDVLK